MASDIVGHRMPFGRKLAYSVGHVLNDLTASMWFSYMIIYFHQVKNFNNDLSGNLVLIGQISDAIFTPFIGFESDRVKGMFKMGKRKSWHFLGTICVIVSFPFLFANCITCANAPDWSQFIYYAPFVVVFQFGWASVQINHLSLIPELTKDEHERVGLNGSRYAFTVLSNMVVYGIAWLIFSLDNSSEDSSDRLNASDAGHFRLLVFIVVGIGAVFCLLFHLGVREKTAIDRDKEDLIDESSALATIERSTLAKQTMSWKCWLKEHQFYQVAAIYMCTRLVVNVSQVYLPMYITETIQLNKDSIAIIPLVVFVSGFVTSLLMRPINRLVGRKVTYFIGLVFSVGACVWYKFVPVKSKMTYGAAILNGIGGSTMLVTSLAMTADLIKYNTESGAFVYGAMSFTDKLSNGAAIALIQYFHPCVACCPKCVDYYRNILSFVPGIVCLVAFVALLTLGTQTLGTRRKKVEVMQSIANGVTKSGDSMEYESIGETDPLLQGGATDPVYVTEVFYDPIDTSSAHASVNSYSGVSEHFYEAADVTSPPFYSYTARDGDNKMDATCGDIRQRDDSVYCDCNEVPFSNNDRGSLKPSRSIVGSPVMSQSPNSGYITSLQDSACQNETGNSPTIVVDKTADGNDSESNNADTIGSRENLLHNKLCHHGYHSDSGSTSPCPSSRGSFLSIEDSDEHHYHSFDENHGNAQSVGHLAKSAIN